MKRYRWARAAVPLLAGLILAGCGDGSEPANPAETPAAATPDPSAPPTPPAAALTPAPPTVQPAAEPPPAAPASPAAAGAAVPPAPVAPAPAEAALAPPAPPPSDEPALLARIAAADVARGEVFAQRCTGCHTIGESGLQFVGPNLFDIVGAPVGRSAGFNYSAAFRALNAAGATWTYGRLEAFLMGPAVAIPGTRDGFGGIADPAERANVIAWLRMRSNDPEPLPLTAAAEAEPAAGGLRPAVFSGLQASRGQDYWDRFGCNACHGSTLRGSPDGPALVGDEFLGKWSGRSLYEFYNTMRRTMPPDNPGGLEDERYAMFVAFILRQNGFEATAEPMPIERAELETMGLR